MNNLATNKNVSHNRNWLLNRSNLNGRGEEDPSADIHLQDYTEHPGN